jgi:hypothetical protein
MSHYNISYAGLEGAAKQQRALEDISDWLGNWRKFSTLTAAFRAEHAIKPLTQRSFTLFAGIAGVQGYPVIAWWNHCFPSRPWKDEEETTGIIIPFPQSAEIKD